MSEKIATTHDRYEIHTQIDGEQHTVITYSQKTAFIIYEQFKNLGSDYVGIDAIGIKEDGGLIIEPNYAFYEAKHYLQGEDVKD